MGGLTVRLDLKDPKIAREVDAALTGLDKPMGEEMASELSGGASRWPSVTGASKRGWGVVVIGPNHVRLANTEDYAPFVEARGAKRTRKAQAGKTARKRPGPARTTLKKGIRPLVETLEGVVTATLRRRGLRG